MRSGNTKEIDVGRLHSIPVIGLVHVEAKKTYRFDSFGNGREIKRFLTIGRARRCDITLTDPTVSLVHCDIIRHPDGTYMIQDAGATNGLIVNDLTVERAILRPGMWIFLGETELIVVGEAGRIRITAGGVTSFEAQAARYYGGDRKAGRMLNKSHSTIGAARRRHKKQRDTQ